MLFSALKKLYIEQYKSIFNKEPITKLENIKLNDSFSDINKNSSFDYGNMSPLKVFTEICEDKEKTSSFFQCKYCPKKFETKQQIGGHTSKKHAGRSLEYQKRLKSLENGKKIKKKKSVLMKIIADEKIY